MAPTKRPSPIIGVSRVLVTPVEAVKIVDPELYYTVQIVLQAFGIILVDLSTGKHIHGQVNLPRIGLITPHTHSAKKPPIGFPLPHSIKKDSITISENDPVDAILICPPEQEITGETQPLYLIIQVIDHRHLDDWESLLTEISLVVSERFGRVRKAKVIFDLTSLCMPDPDDPDSARIAVLRQVQEYGFKDDGGASGDRGTLISTFGNEDDDEEV